MADYCKDYCFFMAEKCLTCSNYGQETCFHCFTPSCDCCLLSKVTKSGNCGDFIIPALEKLHRMQEAHLLQNLFFGGVSHG